MKEFNHSLGKLRDTAGALRMIRNWCPHLQTGMSQCLKVLRATASNPSNWNSLDCPKIYRSKQVRVTSCVALSCFSTLQFSLGFRVCHVDLTFYPCTLDRGVQMVQRFLIRFRQPSKEPCPTRPSEADMRSGRTVHLCAVGLLHSKPSWSGLVYFFPQQKYEFRLRQAPVSHVVHGTIL